MTDTTHQPEWEIRLRQLGFGNQSNIVGSKRVELFNEISQLLTKQFDEVEKEVRNMGDTSDYPGWDGVAGVNVGLIPKEAVLEALETLRKNYATNQ